MTNSLPTSATVLRFAENRIGPKFHRLGRFAQLGLNTADFFCLPREHYDEFFKDITSQIKPILKKLNESDEQDICLAANQIKQSFCEHPFPESLRQQILASFDSQFESDQGVAVRATIIGDEQDQGEDGESEPFAGMSESFLNVVRADVVEKVRLCWASGFSQQAILYRIRQNYNPLRFGVAVAVQKMVASSKSFVAFSCDPQTQARETLIAVGSGLGELVVQEKTEIEHVRVDQRSGEIIRSPNRQNLNLLSDDQIRSVDQAVQVLEAAFSLPQDVEGSFDDDGHLFILQTRPIAIDQQRYRLWSSANISESFPGVTTPLTFSVARQFYADLNRDYYRRCGVSRARMNAVDPAFDRLLGYLDGRIYHCISNFQQTTAIHPLARFFESDYDRFVCELEHDYRRPTSEVKPSVLVEWSRIAWASMLAVGHYFTLPWKFWRFTTWWKKLKRTVPSPPNESCANRLLDRLDQIWNETSRRWGITLINYQQMVYFHSKAEKYLGRWCQDPQATLAELLSDGNRLFGSEVVANALRIADLIRADASVSKQFSTQSAEKIWQEVKRGNFEPRFTTLIYQHLDQYGVRGLEELKMEVPNLRSQPAEFIQILQNYVKGDQRYRDLVEREKRTARGGFWKFARSVYFNPLKMWTISVVMKSLRKALERRELGRYMRGELFGFTKEHLFAIADELVARNCIDRQDDILFLSLEEIRDFVEGRSYTQDLKSIIQLRQREASTFQHRNPKKEMTTYGIVNQCLTQETSTIKSDLQISGLGSCAGIVRGRARVIRRPSLNEKFDPDDILVAPETDPGWLYLMLRAKGIVVERGSMLSHTAITGRRFAIPTVVAATDACQVIADGDEIQIDGQAGTVEILKRVNDESPRSPEVPAEQLSEENSGNHSGHFGKEPSGQAGL